ncbi:unnamed protein product [Durusdinium trenchii]|uniref:Uncharacterized protein n=1 Tax=Durusdinium trenchii TaxID=1381693 RepID=A0ABP0HI61_9DINO
MQVPGAEEFEVLKGFTVEPQLVWANQTTLQCYENVKLHVPGGPENLRRAWFGVPSGAWRDAEHVGAECSEAVRRLMETKRPIITSPGTLGCDPVPGVWKQFRLELVDNTGFSAEEPVTLRYFKTLEEVPSARESRWVAFIRHAQAGHNVEKALIMNPDNALTDEGVAQALRGREGPAGETVRAAELLVTSPLTRAMQTAGLLMGDCSVPVHVDAGITERWSAPCDEGTPKSELLLKSLPGLEHFSTWNGWDALEEVWWTQPGEDQWARAEAFVAKVREMPQDRIAFVGHGGFWDTAGSPVNFASETCALLKQFTNGSHL